MYTLGQLRRGISRGLDTPTFFLRELNRLYHRRVGLRECNTTGTRIMDEDWDTLLVLDACRYDTFAARNDLPGRLESRRSRGSHTVEFLEGNFAGGTFRDTVYVTASPQLYRNRERLAVSFHATVDIWESEGWDDTHGTVLPETTTDYALQAHERYPNKRVIVHYLQPHYPFIGAEDLNTRTFGQDESALDIWGNLMRNNLDVSTERLWSAYEDNLRLTLDAIEPLLTTVDGKTVVTADHGNMIGERSRPIPIREWGHPVGVYTDQLVKVPWFVSERGPRRTIVAGDAEGEERDDERAIPETTVEDRLEDLGYV